MGKKGCNEIVKKSNALIRSYWTVESVLEPRIVAVLASKVRRDDEDFKVYRVPVFEVLGKDAGGRDYKEIEHVVDRIMGRVLTIRESLTRVHKYNVFNKCTIDTKEMILELGFHPDLKPHYLQLKERFTQYSLAEFMSLPSIYSQRLYEILKSWSDKPEITIEINDLFEMLDVPKSLRSDFRNFRLRVLEKAHKDIVERDGSSLWFDWEPIKKGRNGKVEAVRFVFSESRAQELSKNQPPPDEVFIHQQLQRQSNGCFERLAKRGVECAPRLKTEKCRFCTTRGRMASRTRQKLLIDDAPIKPEG
jgi:plasmid replication initiation protein